MTFLTDMEQAVLAGGQLSQAEALKLFDAPLKALCAAADGIRRRFCGNAFDLCTIINAKSGRCSEDCKFCAQSAHYASGVEEYPLLPVSEFVADARKNAARGVLRYSPVTSGRALSDAEVDHMCGVVRALRGAADIRLCASFGLLNGAQYCKLRAAGLERVHNNLETSRRHFPKMCTTHTFGDKLASIEAAQRAGLSVCSGGIFGIGEDNADRVSLAFSLRALGIGSVPMNLLNPIAGTPYGGRTPLSADEFLRIVAVYRFVLPCASIRLAGGRGLLPDGGRACFASGANAAITGDMLTTAGISVESDLKMLAELGYEVRAHA